MAEQLAPIEEDLWKLALACTNRASGAARVVASIARDHPDLGRVSEARLRREALVRAELWVARPESGAEAPVCQTLEPLGLIQRACVWLEGGPGLSVAEIGWICERDAPAIRRTLDEGRSRLGGESRAIADDLRVRFDTLDRAELFNRLHTARDAVRRREKRSAMLLVGALAVFVVLMTVVLFDLLSWQDASQTLPSGNNPPATVDPLP